MKGKVKCTCGWSWNKSDSSAKDMYICHECGRDNSNNMKNGGWMDNYNDSKASAPEGMVGDGFSNVGRNYSPAWGGQFEEGGEIPMAQKGERVPATRSDSLVIFNNAKNLEDYFTKQKYKKTNLKINPNLQNSINETKKWEKEARNAKVDTFGGIITLAEAKKAKQKQINEASGWVKEITNKLNKEKKEIKDKNDVSKYLSNLEKSRKEFDERLPGWSRYTDEQGIKRDESKILPEQYYKPLNENQFYQREASSGNIDLRSPMALYDTRITPQSFSVFDSPDLVTSDALEYQIANTSDYKKRDKLNKQLNDFRDNPNTNTDRVEMYQYDPLAVMPFDILKEHPELIPERIKKYGIEGIPTSVIQQHPEWVQTPMTDPAQRQPVQSLRSLTPLQPVGTQIEASLPVIRPEAQIPKSYDVSTVFNSMKGPTTGMRFDREPFNRKEATLEQAMQILEYADKYNANIQKKYGPESELSRRSSRIAEMAADRANKIKLEVAVKPNYQMGGNVYPVNYVPQAAMGASMPGAVGFTYARTNDPAPSEGPYAKKTMASAKNGGWLDQYDEAQDGERVLPNNRALQILANIQKRKQGKGKPSTEFSNIKIKDERAEAIKPADNTRTAPKLKVTDLKKMSVRNKTEAELAEIKRKNNEAIAAERKAVREKADANPLNQWSAEFFDSDNWTRQNMEDAAAGLESKYRYSDEPNFFDDWINPASWAGRMAANLGAAPNQIVQQDSMMPLISAIAEPVVSGAIGPIVGPYISKAVKPIKKAAAKAALPILETAKSVNDKIYNKAFDLASSYRANNKNIMQKAIEAANAGNAWTREWYSNPKIQARYNEWINPANKFMDPKTALFHSNIENAYPGLSSINLDKSFANKLSGTIARNNLEKLLVEGKFTNPVTNGLGSRNIVGRYSHGLNDALVNIAHPGFNKRIFGKGYDVANTFVHENIHALTKGDFGFKPEYLQKFKEPFKGLTGLTKHQKYLVKPTEVHARIGELRRTFGLTPETVVDDNMINNIIKQGLKGKTSVEKDFFKLIKDKVKFKELMNTAPAGVIGVGLGAGALQQQREGGIIKDDRGQWAHPGEITEINSNDITMQGVPYPVLGISDTGDTKLMKPGKNYKFKGKKVTEFPMAKNGLRQEQKGLVNLDQLTNFTNYNKPQPGGWLNKYN